MVLARKRRRAGRNTCNPPRRKDPNRGHLIRTPPGPSKGPRAGLFPAARARHTKSVQVPFRATRPRLGPFRGRTPCSFPPAVRARLTLSVRPKEKERVCLGKPGCRWETAGHVGEKGPNEGYPRRHPAAMTLPVRRAGRLAYPVDYRISRPDYRYSSGKTAIVGKGLQRPI